MLVDTAQYPVIGRIEVLFESVRDEVATLPHDAWLPWTGPNGTNIQVLPLLMPYRPPWIDEAFDARRRLLPRSWQALSALPEVYSIVLSRLNPGGRILPHCDMEEPESLRCHLPLSLPKPGTSGFRVGETRFEWQVGRCVAFHTDQEHEGFNDGDAPRDVMILDLHV